MKTVPLFKVNVLLFSIPFFAVLAGKKLIILIQYDENNYFQIGFMVAVLLKMVPGLIGRVETILQIITIVKPLLPIAKTEMRYAMVIWQVQLKHV